MQYNPEELNEILNIYKAESEEIIQELNDGFLTLEKNPKDKTPLKKLLQLVHSLKGASRMISFTSVQDISHKLEDILSYWKKEDITININSFQLIYEVCDYLTALVEKSVKQKTNYEDKNLLLFINKLNNLINSNKTIPVDKMDKLPDNYLAEKSIDIKAFILELLFVIEKNNVKEDEENAFLVISEDIKQLAEIFEPTNYNEVKEKIAAILSNISLDNDICNESLKHNIIELKNIIYNLYKELNINSNINRTEHKDNTKKVKKEEKKEIKEAENDINKEFDFILANLQKIRYEKDFILRIINVLRKTIKKTTDKRISLILTKTINILNLFYSKDIIIDNDCYMVILQCIYLTKRMSLNEKEENLNNLNFLIQRLSVVEDMFNIEDIQPTKPIEIHQNNNLLSQEEYSNLKKNLKTIDLQEIKTLRVDTSKLDNLISQTGELLINGIKTREHIIELSKINSKIVKWNAVSKKIINYLKYLEKKGFFNSELDDSASMFYKRAQDFFVNNAEIINEINNDFTRLYNIISEDDNKLHQTAMEIEIIAKGIRVLPLATLFHSFPRMMRDIANENNKKIDFIISGSDTTVDKKIIEEIKMPLIHILRNSVSHGIETPEQRLKNNKKETGIVKLTAKQVENNVIITIEDDGYGVDIEKVKEIAIKKALLTDEEISNMSNEQLMKLLFLPGFSTEESINEISGRGIGLDIVKTKITNLNGDIIIDSILNKGCKVTIKLPLSMSTIKTFILLVNNQKYAIPVNSIKFVKKISKEEIFMRNGMNCIIYEDHSIPVYYLSEVFGEINNLDKETQLTVIIIENQEKQAAYVIDKLLGDHEVFQKKLIPPILRIRNISGFTTLSTGEICLIINPFELIRNTVSSLHISSSAIKQIPIEED
ncbi:TPA: chemotaxis protein CheW [Candidatus Avigastranaerophilus faecigallinarum]|nr:chemotaxis protein CheW [Candidatus Avigastranaerophilus faecigallinarum]